MILLDTHCWIWIQIGATDRFSSKELLDIEEAAAHDMLGVSIISIWEVCMLEERGRIRFDRPCWAWIETALAIRGQQPIPMAPRVAYESTRLPGSLHGDPADRIIVATARSHGARLLTRDQKLLEYAAKGHIQLV
jgi:PIN domain nuclease of toxin-antitoxin system